MSTWQQAVVPNKTARPDVKDLGGRVVQHHFVRAQVREINEYRSDILMDPTRVWLGQRLGGLRPNYAPDRVKIEQALTILKQRLQSAELTINFEAWKWFKEPNDCASYQQIYERAVQTVNDNQARMGRTEIRLPNKDKNRHDDDHRVMGLDKLRQDPRWAGVTRFMDTGGLNQHVSGEYNTLNNKSFSAKTRPVFAGLNYGRRPHGSTPIFGRSQLVLSDKFKTNAIYYPVDTCVNEMDGERKLQADQSHMVTYDLLPAVCPMAHSSMQEDLFKSCVMRHDLPDVSVLLSNQFLLEAHLYEPLLFSPTTVKEIRISFNDQWFQDNPDKKYIVGENVLAWGRKFHIIQRFEDY
jgi:hypothetical protein